MPEEKQCLLPFQIDIIINDNEDEEDTNCCKYGKLARKISIHRYVKHIPIFSSRNPSTKEGNNLLKHHIQSMMNFLSVRSHDYVNTSKHKTTTLYSTNSNKLDSFEKLEKVFNDKLRNNDLHFVNLLPISINVQTQQ